MSVKIRLTRMGKKKQPSYRVVVMDSRRPRDGAYIEQIGTYDPRREPSLIEIDNDKAVDWLRKGAQPTDRARKLLEISGAWTRFRVAKGDIHTIEHTTETRRAHHRRLRRAGCRRACRRTGRRSGSGAGRRGCDHRCSRSAGCRTAGRGARR